MSKEKLEREAAFPEQTWEYDAQNNVLNSQNPGMSKRFYAACAAMQGLMVGVDDPVYENIAKISFKMADELLKQENL